MTLKRYFIALGGFDNTIAKFLLNGRCIGNHRSFANHIIPLFLFVNHGGGGVMTNVSDYGNIRLDALCDHFSATQSNFFLHRICDVKTKWKFYFILMQQSCDFSNHKPPNAIVEGAAHKLIFIKDMKSIWIGNHTSNMNTHFLDFFFVFCSNINGDIFKLRGIFFTSHSGVDCWPAKYAFHHTLFRVDIHPL